MWGLFVFLWTCAALDTECLPNSTQACYPVFVFRTGGYSDVGCQSATCDWELMGVLMNANSPPLSITWPDEPAGLGNSYASVEAQAIDVYGRMVFSGNQRNHSDGVPSEVLVPAYLVTGQPFVNIDIWCRNPITDNTSLALYLPTPLPPRDAIAYPVAVYRTGTNALPTNNPPRCSRSCDGWTLQNYLLNATSSLVVSWPPVPTTNLTYAFVEVQAIDARGRVVYRNAARDCTVFGSNCDNSTLATRQASILVNARNFSLTRVYIPPFAYCNYTVETSFPSLVVVVPYCVSGLAYVHPYECNTTFTNNSLPAELIGTDYGLCPLQFPNLLHCGVPLSGWTDNLIGNGRGQLPNSSLWYVSKGTYVNQGPGLGFLPTNPSLSTKPTLRSQLIDLVAFGIDEQLLDTFPPVLVIVRVRPSGSGIDRYRYRVELRTTSDGPAVGNALFNDVNSQKINGAVNFSQTLRPSTSGSFRFLYFEDSATDETAGSNDGPYISEVAVYLNLNECLENNGGCHPQRQCIDQLTPIPRCGDCSPGYQIDGDYNCTRVNLCLLSTLCPEFSYCTFDNSPQGYSCLCNPGYAKNGSTCEDVNECLLANDTNGGCGAQAVCFNVPGALSSQPVCFPSVTNCSLTLDNVTGCSFLLPTNDGGQTLSVSTLSTEPFTTVYFGPVYDPQRFQCQSVAFFNGTVSCVLPVGAVGQDLAFTFVLCTSDCYLVDARTGGTFAFANPSISNNTLRFYPGNSTTNNLTSSSNFGEVIAVDGTNFIGPAQVSQVSDYVVILFNGANSLPCHLLSMTQLSTLVCETPRASGTGYRIRIMLNSTVLVTGNDVYNYRDAPSIYSVSGCLTSHANGTANCPTYGQIMINVSGAGFGSSPTVLVGGKVCNRMSIMFSNATNQVVQCQLPPLTGVLVNVVVVVDALTISLPAPLVSYAAPNITSMTGCPGLLSTSFEAFECDRTGQSTLTFQGTNFGMELPNILIGDQPCLNVTMIVPHEKVRCQVPPNTGVDHDVLFLAFGGTVGFPTLKLSYQRCLPGTASQNTLNCTTCLPGTYTNDFGLPSCLNCADGYSSPVGATGCFQCAAGSYAVGGMSSCVFCPPGTFSVDAASSACTECPRGTFNAFPNRTYCQDCAPGTYQEFPNSLSCTNCSIGQYAEFEQTQSCSACAKGRYADTIGQSRCSDCNPGKYTDDIGAGSCRLCAPGTEAPGSGTIQCTPCRFGHFSAVNGTEQCAPCERGKSQSNPGQAFCTVCTNGTAQPSEGRDVCDPCLPGTYNDGSSPSLCLNCDAGTSATSKFAANCDLCEVGTFSEVGSKSCSKCIFGYYTSDNRSDSCFPCPIGAASTESRNTCDCPVGTYGVQRTNSNRTVLSCLPCKKGSRCETTGVTLQTLQVLPGYWRPNSLSDHYYLCRNRQLCLGGINSSCIENREGLLCGICKEGYTASSNEKACTLCPTQSVSWGYTFLILLALFFVLLLCYYITLKIYNTQQKLLIDLSKEHDKNDVQKMRQLLQEYDVGDEYFSSLRAAAAARAVETDEEEQKDPVVDPPAVNNLPARESLPASAEEVNTKIGGLTVQAQHLLNTYLLRKSRNIRKAPNFIYKVKILLGFFQVASLMPLNSGIDWPRQWQSFIVAFSLFNFDFVPWSNLGCATSVDFLDKAMIVGFVPIVAILLLAAMTFVFFRADTRLLIDTQLEIQQRKEAAWRQFVKLVLFTIFLLYPFASKITLAVYNCADIEGHSYLVSDLSLSCETTRYTAIVSFNILFLLLYPIGVPVTYFFLLNRAKSSFRDPRTLLQYGFLYDAYTHDRWYWEILDMLHKLALTSLVTFLPANTVLIASMVVTIGYMDLLLVGHPYVRKGDDRFHLWVQCNLFLLALMGQILGTIEHPYDAGFASPDTMEILLSLLLIGINIGLLLAFLVIAGRNVRKLYVAIRKEQPKQPPAGGDFARPSEPESEPVPSLPQHFYATVKPVDL